MISFTIIVIIIAINNTVGRILFGNNQLSVHTKNVTLILSFIVQ